MAPIDPKRPLALLPKWPTGLKIAGAFLLLAPFTTFILIVLKGLPDFAEPHVWEVLLWVYSVTWLPAFLAGLSLEMIVVNIASRTPNFHQPYDFGRSFSLGAVLGALTEAFATWLYRAISQRLFSDFWIAGAMIAGCLTGGVVVAAVLWQSSLKKTR